MAMGENDMAEDQVHTDMGHMNGPENTLPMMMGEGRYGKLEMGAFFPWCAYAINSVKSPICMKHQREPKRKKYQQYPLVFQFKK